MRVILKFFYKLCIRILEDPVNFLIIKMNKVSYVKFPKINGTIFIRNHGLIRIGSGVTINSKMSANPIGGSYKTSIAVKKNATLQIGNNVGISNCALMCNKSITIGDNTMIGGGCRIYDTDFHSIDYRDRIIENDINVVEKPVVIGENVFIGAGTTILKGVQIGDKSVVGACSVVTKSIPDGQLWAGNPAKFIKTI